MGSQATPQSLKERIAQLESVRNTRGFGNSTSRGTGKQKAFWESERDERSQRAPNYKRRLPEIQSHFIPV